MVDHKQVITHYVRLTAEDIWKMLKEQSTKIPENLPSSLWFAVPNRSAGTAAYIDVQWTEEK